MTQFIDSATVRSRAESLMTSTCRIFTAGPPVTDPDTGEVTRSEVSPVITKCRIRPRGSRGSTGAEAGGAELMVTGYIVSVPFDLSPPPANLQRVVVLTSPDASLIGLPLEIRDVARGDNISARRLICQEAA